jgi:predicted Zn-dependent protease with MMP-like domain
MADTPADARLEALAEDELARLARRLPRSIRSALDEVPVHLEARPNPEIEQVFGPDLLGLFSGEPVHERGESLHPEPPQIHLYLSNIWASVDQDNALFVEELRITLLHELGHYLGWDEADMERLGID